MTARTTRRRRADGGPTDASDARSSGAPYTRPVTRPVAPTGRGRFITIEGPGGRRQDDPGGAPRGGLRARGVAVRGTREPGGTALGERIRELLLAPTATPIDPLADALLFNAARRQLVEEVIEPALAGGTTVICARFADSTRAYQGYGGGLRSRRRCDQLEEIATGGLQPDLTLLLDLPVEVGLARKAPGRPDPVRDRLRPRVPPPRPERLPRDGGPRAGPVPGVRRDRRRGRGRRADRRAVDHLFFDGSAPSGEPNRPTVRIHP